MPRRNEYSTRLRTIEEWSKAHRPAVAALKSKFAISPVNSGDILHGGRMAEHTEVGEPPSSKGT
jgi:hypothetical protein